MRDVERLREKVELSLDDRQIAGLAFAALLLLGGVFALGLMVGKNLAARAPVSQPAGDLAALDEAQKQEAARPVAPRAAPVEKPAAEPEVADAAVVAAPAEAHKADPEPEAHKAEPAAAAAHKESAAPAAHKPEPAAAAHKEPASAHKEPAHKAETLAVAAQKPVVVEPAKHAEVRSAQDIALTPPPRDLAAFTIQIGASQEKADAQRLEQRARGAGLKPYVVEAQLGNKGTWYRVRVGSFKDKDAANRYRKDVERELRQSAVVMPTH